MIEEQKLIKDTVAKKGLDQIIDESITATKHLLGSLQDIQNKARIDNRTTTDVNNNVSVVQVSISQLMEALHLTAANSLRREGIYEEMKSKTYNHKAKFKITE